MNIPDLQYRYQIKRTADSQFFTGRVKNVSIDNNNFISDICDCQLYIRKDSTGAYRYDCSNRIKCDRGVLDASQTFSGYVNSNVILCVGMFVVGQALLKPAWQTRLVGVVTRFAKNEKNPDGCHYGDRRSHVRIPVKYRDTAVLIPVVCGIADESGYSEAACSCHWYLQQHLAEISLHYRSTGKSDGCGCPAESW